MMGQWIDETETLRTTKMARGGRDYLLGVVDAEAEFMESVANELLTACCRIWMRKGNELTEAFGTAVFERYLNLFFKERRLFFFRRLERKKRKSEDGPLVPQFSQEDRKAAVDQYERLLRVLQARLRLRVAAGVDAFAPAIQVLRVTRSKRRGGKASNSKKRSIILDAIRMNLTGREYCKCLDSYKVPPSNQWLAYEWPNSYEKAYLASPKWKKRIQDEKCNYRRRAAIPSSISFPSSLVTPLLTSNRKRGDLAPQHWRILSLTRQFGMTQMRELPKCARFNL